MVFLGHTYLPNGSGVDLNGLKDSIGLNAIFYCAGGMW